MHAGLIPGHDKSSFFYLNTSFFIVATFSLFAAGVKNMPFFLVSSASIKNDRRTNKYRSLTISALFRENPRAVWCSILFAQLSQSALPSPSHHAVFGGRRGLYLRDSFRLATAQEKP